MKEQRLVEAEVYLKHKDGYRIPVITRISPVKDENGVVTGAVELFSDNSAKIAAFQKMEKPEQLAFIDSLTGVGNRRYSEIKIAAKLEEMNRYARFGLLFTDIDNFKQFNDTHGHDTGDRVLKLADRSVMSNLREDDFAGRWGGEEFIAIISNVNREEFVATADKLRGMIERSSLEMAGQEPSHVTVSVGAVVAKRDDDMENLVMKARKTAGIL